MATFVGMVIMSFITAPERQLYLWKLLKPHGAVFLNPDEPVNALVAEIDGELIGLTHYIFHRSTTAIGQNCYLQDLFTSKAARGKGVGRALINGVL